MVQAALFEIHGRPVRVTCAGRTDAGVHASGQVAHYDLQPGEQVEARAVQGRLRRLLPEDVLVREVSVAPEGFDARFSALWRRYVYRIVDDPRGVEPLLRNFVTHVPHELDVEAMNVAACRLLGLHDFAAYCKPREGATTVRTLLACEVRRTPAWIEVEVKADAFCHSMVRSLVGGLLPVGRGRRGVDWPEQVLNGRERDPVVAVTPARGLELVEVRYPQPSELADRASQTRAVRGAM